MLKKSIILFSFIILTNGCSSKNEFGQTNLIPSLNNETVISYEDYKKLYENDKKIEKKEVLPKTLYKDTIKENDNFTDRIYVKQALMEFYDEWKHVKYKFGGNSKRGIDCSAFTQRIFKNKFKMSMPRTTISQVKKGQKIHKSQLKPGDLVFFKSRKHGRHVGIYVGDGKFMHASIKGVKFSKLNKNYYKKNYWQARRVLF